MENPMITFLFATGHILFECYSLRSNLRKDQVSEGDHVQF